MKTLSGRSAQLTMLAIAITLGSLAAGNLAAGISAPAGTSPQDELFFDDFESGLGDWDISNEDAIAIVDSGDSVHGKVLRLSPADARLRALIRGSAAWSGYRIEGEVFFPEDRHNYLGLIFHYNEHDGRVDLGSIYIKGNGSYIRVNPRRDWNPHRMLYEEMRSALTGDDAIQIGQWQRFAAEVAEIQFSSIDDLAVWINGRFYGYAYRDSLAWYDFGYNPDHPPTVSIPLTTGNSHVLVRVRGGVYASGGFFARVARE